MIGKTIYVVTTAEEIAGQMAWVNATRAGAVRTAADRTNDLLRKYGNRPRATPRNWRHCFPKAQPLVWIDEAVLEP